jgi:hypothetical protein
LRLDPDRVAERIDAGRNAAVVLGNVDTVEDVPFAGYRGGREHTEAGTSICRWSRHLAASLASRIVGHASPIRCRRRRR